MLNFYFKVDDISNLILLISIIIYITELSDKMMTLARKLLRELWLFSGKRYSTDRLFTAQQNYTTEISYETKGRLSNLKKIRR